MDGDGFDDLWSSQPSASGPARAGHDLNSQAPVAEGFPGLRLYGDFLQGDDVELLPGRGRGSGLPPYRPPRAGAGDAWATPASPYARQLHLFVLFVSGRRAHNSRPHQIRLGRSQMIGKVHLLSI